MTTQQDPSSPVCQHCEQPVRWDKTEHGFPGFVHEANDLTECPTEDTDTEVEADEAEPTTTYTAEFVRAAHAAEFVERVTTQDYGCTNVEHRSGRRKVTFDGPATRQYRLDIAETIGYFGSPPMGPVAKLDGYPTPRSY